EAAGAISKSRERPLASYSLFPVRGGEGRGEGSVAHGGEQRSLAIRAARPSLQPSLRFSGEREKDDMYLDLIATRIKNIRRDVCHLTSLGERMAASLLEGGALFTPALGTYWPSEFGGRAGGIVGLKPANYVAKSPND